MPKSKELVSSSSSASDSDSEVDKKAKRKKQAALEKPVKKQKTGESSKGSASSKQSSNRDENMFQLKGELQFKTLDINAWTSPLKEEYNIFSSVVECFDLCKKNEIVSSIPNEVNCS
ncbi:activated RNA polymerase II transcriptional coactivator p15-like isoform X3 [Rissa tridactyla]|uniref:activated RNA polymerase II transcriptional coactivator p15-like isoform X3 n=1 Tax=Rissa tridactyla TaxID=75485 RepID=UPI0023BA6FC0|nr:activated RNA polymerase II transcriptional coactivator p15-like isoform X3 [Rissa tridactyla]